jgi:hypothetical protein
MPILTLMDGMTAIREAYTAIAEASVCATEDILVLAIQLVYGFLP